MVKKTMETKRKYFWKNMGELKVKATYKNHALYQKVVDSKNGCYIDHLNMEIRVLFNKPFYVLSQARMQSMEVLER